MRVPLVTLHIRCSQRTSEFMLSFQWLDTENAPGSIASIKYLTSLLHVSRVSPVLKSSREVKGRNWTARPAHMASAACLVALTLPGKPFPFFFS